VLRKGLDEGALVLLRNCFFFVFFVFCFLCKRFERVSPLAGWRGWGGGGRESTAKERKEGKESFDDDDDDDDDDEEVGKRNGERCSFNAPLPIKPSPLSLALLSRSLSHSLWGVHLYVAVDALVMRNSGSELRPRQEAPAKGHL